MMVQMVLVIGDDNDDDDYYSGKLKEAWFDCVADPVIVKDVDHILIKDSSF